MCLDTIGVLFLADTAWEAIVQCCHFTVDKRSIIMPLQALTFLQCPEIHVVCDDDLLS